MVCFHTLAKLFDFSLDWVYGFPLRLTDLVLLVSWFDQLSLFCSHHCNFQLIASRCLWSASSSRAWGCFVVVFLTKYLFLRERERAHVLVAERGGEHRIWSRLQAQNCHHRAPCGVQTHKPWDHNLRWSWTLNWLSHPGAPCCCSFFTKLSSPAGQVPTMFISVSASLTVLSTH